MWALSLLWALSLFWMLPGSVYFAEISFDICNTSGVVIPCTVTHVEAPMRVLNVEWRHDGYDLVHFRGFENEVDKTIPFSFQDMWNISKGDVSINIPLKYAVPGEYQCKVEVTTINWTMQFYYAECWIELLQYGSPFWFQPVESSLIIAAVITLAALFLLQVGYVAMKFEMSLIKKISFGVAVLILMIFVVPGASLLVKEGYTVETQFGLGLVVLPAVILVPPLFFVFQSVFDKPPLFAFILIILKALGYAIAVAGMVASLSECPPKQASVVIAGLGIMDLVAVIAFTYMVEMGTGFCHSFAGTSFKDHQPPKQRSKAI